MRHLKKTNSLSRQPDARRALLKNLMTSLVLHGRLETTVPKAKAVQPMVDRLMSRGKAMNAHEQKRLAGQMLTTKVAQRKFVQEWLPAVKARTSGFTRIVRTGFRFGDHATQAVLMMVDGLDGKPNTVAKKAAKQEKKAEAAHDHASHTHTH